MQSVHHRFWPKGLPHEIRVPQVPLTHYLETAARRYPDKTAIVYAGAALSYARLLERVEALAGFLRERLGVQAGDRVLLMSQNCPQFVVAFYGVLRVGAVVVPVNAMTTAAELRHYIDDSGARVAIAAAEPTGERPAEPNALQRPWDPCLTRAGIGPGRAGAVGPAPTTAAHA